jgi:SAM-dependent methyltransferase
MGLLKTVVKKIVFNSLFVKPLVIIKLRLTKKNNSHNYLNISDLYSLSKSFSYNIDYNYDQESLHKRAQARASDIHQLIVNRRYRVINILEIGCGDGLIGHYLQKYGYRYEGIDIKINTSLSSNVRQMDASCLTYSDNVFDMVFSFNSFEHFPAPAIVLKEAIRVTRSKGLIFSDFGPLFYSPFGLHAYRSIPVPYCQFLFSTETLNYFIKENRLPEINFEQLNGWSAYDFKKLFNSLDKKIIIKKLIFKKKYKYFPMILKYSYCFSKDLNIDNYFVSSIEFLFEKK